MAHEYIRALTRVKVRGSYGCERRLDERPVCYGTNSQQSRVSIVHSPYASKLATHHVSISGTPTRVTT
eukprot:scaffold631241_cov36-Prasinocladus_malaysianus.AAC.1